MQSKVHFEVQKTFFTINKTNKFQTAIQKKNFNCNIDFNNKSKTQKYDYNILSVSLIASLTFF